MLLVLSARLCCCCICSMHAHFLLRVNARLISLHLLVADNQRKSLLFPPRNKKKSYMMDLFSLAPDVFGENGSEIHPRSSSPSDLSSRPQYEENRFLDFPFFSFPGPLTFSWRLIDSQRRATDFGRVRVT